MKNGKKKLPVLVFVLIVLFTCIAGAEDGAVPQTGTWYADLQGVPVEMELSEDGTYSICIPGQDPETGTWELRNGTISLDGSRDPEFSVIGEKLAWNGAYTFFSREKMTIYDPVEVIREAPTEFADGYWKSLYINVDGTVCLASAVNDKTDLYVEGTAAILGGPVFHDVQVKMEKTEDGLICQTDGMSVLLQLQADGFLRLTVAGTDTAPQTWYLLRAYSPILDGENPAEAAAEP